MIDITVNVDEKLSLNKFEVDEENAHIKIKEGVKASDPEFQKLVMCCPAALTRCPLKATSLFLTMLVASSAVRAA